MKATEIKIPYVASPHRLYSILCAIMLNKVSKTPIIKNPIVKFASMPGFFVVKNIAERMLANPTPVNEKFCSLKSQKSHEFLVYRYSIRRRINILLHKYWAGVIRPANATLRSFHLF